jgi:hypothetical protein
MSAPDPIEVEPPRKRKGPRDLTLRRLKAGEQVLKTHSPQAQHGAYWTWVESGHLASANVCARLERLGLLTSSDGLPGIGDGQTFEFTPLPEKT